MKKKKGFVNMGNGTILFWGSFTTGACSFNHSAGGAQAGGGGGWGCYDKLTLS